MNNAHTSETLNSDHNKLLQNCVQDHAQLFPHRLAQSFPHIVEKIGMLWPEPIQAKAYFQELLTTQRESRQGFPQDIHHEIFALSNFYEECHPALIKKDNFWNWVSGHRDH